MIKIRPVKKDEVEKLQKLNDEAFVNNCKYDSDFKRDWSQSLVGKNYFTDSINNPEAIFLVAEDNDILVGYIVAAPKEVSYRLSKYIEIENLGVSPSHHLKGVGTMLLEKVFNLAKERGFQRAYANSYWENTGAIKFYEKNGFKKIDVSLERDI